MTIQENSRTLNWKANKNAEELFSPLHQSFVKSKSNEPPPIRRQSQVAARHEDFS